MDPLTHGVLGGLSGIISFRKAKMVRIAALCGMCAGMAPDLDIFLRSASDPMFTLGFHRHFTHSLFFVPFGALLVAALAWLLFRHHATFGVLYLACFAGMQMHGLLDTMTNYGTHLFWPFANVRESWNIISIIDPLFTLPLLCLLFLAVRRRVARFAIIAAAYALCYWTLGYIQHERATDEMVTLAAARGHKVERSEVKPSFANLIVWRTQYQYAGRTYVDAFHMGPFSRVHYEGDNVALYTAPAIAISTQASDVQYFTFFSDGWVGETAPNIISDLRFSMLPQRITPLWGIKLKPEQPDEHVDFIRLSRRDAKDFQVLWQMVKGKAL